MEKSNKKNQEELLEIYASHIVVARQGVEVEEITETRKIHQIIIVSFVCGIPIQLESSYCFTR